jgi:hypothetical protein
MKRRTCVAIFVMFALTVFFPGPGSSQTTKKNLSRWKPAIYHGLIVGKSSPAHVIRILGKPHTQGKGGETVLPYFTYPVSDPVPGVLTVYFSNGAVDSMFLRPDPTISRKELIQLFGPEFQITRYSFDECLAKEGEDSGPVYEDPDGDIEEMEYRQRGMVIEFSYNDVDDIVFVAGRTGPTHSLCKDAQNSSKNVSAKPAEQSRFAQNPHTKSAAESVLKFDTPGIELEGTLTERMFYGPPGFGETPEKDSQDRVLVLQLKKPITVEPVKNAGSKNSLGLETVRHVLLVQLFFDRGHQSQARKLLGKKIRVEGTLDEAVAPRQYTNVTMSVIAIDPN